MPLVIPFDRPFEMPFDRPFEMPFDRPFLIPFEMPFERPFVTPLEIPLVRQFERPFDMALRWFSPNAGSSSVPIPSQPRLPTASISQIPIARIRHSFRGWSGRSPEGTQSRPEVPSLYEHLGGQ